jgi:ThiF family
MAWRLTLANSVVVRFQLPAGSPLAHPLLYLEMPEPSSIHWRNVELDGKMCLFPPGSPRFPMLRPEAVMHVLDAMDGVVATNLSGDAPKDVIVSRQHWVNHFGGCWSLIDPKNAPCRGVAAETQGVWVLAETEVQFRNWRSNTKRYLDTTAPLLAKWVDRFDDIPVKLSDLGQEEREIFAQGGLVLYYVETESGPLGFAIAATAQHELTRFWVERADRDWLHERGGAGFDMTARDVRVTVVGCGSLGAGVAELLVRSGVGSITLVDDDYLNWGNVARHALGGHDVARLKVEALATKLRQHIPTVELVKAYPSTWQSVAVESPEALECDLIISTIATWPDELALARWAQERSIPLVMGWIEGSAIAGHALALQGGCLCRLFGPSGNFRRAAAQWIDTSPFKYAQACHENYYPYGYADVVPVQSMIAALATDILSGHVKGNIHRCRLPHKAGLKAAGAEPTPDYLQLHSQGSLSCRWQELERDWPDASDCWYCS